MKTLFLILFIATSTQAGWRKLGPGGGQGVSKEACEGSFGPPCFREGEVIPAEVSGELKMAKDKDGGEVVVVDNDALLATRAEKEAQAKAAEASKEADRLQLERLKAVVESKDPSQAELREALNILLSKQLKDVKVQVPDVIEVPVSPAPILRGRP